MTRALAIAAVFLGLAAHGAVGRVSAVVGEAQVTRTERTRALVVGEAVELNDLIEVRTGNVELTLLDQSVIRVGPGSRFRVAGDGFVGAERKGISIRLLVGQLWARVKRAVQGGRFEVRTDRAVAGVRGTVFRVDEATLVGRAARQTVVRVYDGKVDVARLARPETRPVPDGGRRQVPGPTEVTKDEYERLVQLQMNQQITVTDDLFEVSPLVPPGDDFSRWIDERDRAPSPKPTP